MSASGITVSSELHVGFVQTQGHIELEIKFIKSVHRRRTRKNNYIVLKILVLLCQQWLFLRQKHPRQGVNEKIEGKISAVHSLLAFAKWLWIKSGMRAAVKSPLPPLWWENTGRNIGGVKLIYPLPCKSGEIFGVLNPVSPPASDSTILMKGTSENGGRG